MFFAKSSAGLPVQDNVGPKIRMLGFYDPFLTLVVRVCPLLEIASARFDNFPAARLDGQPVYIQ